MCEINSKSTPRAIAKYKSRYGCADLCINCEFAVIMISCDKCGDGVCMSERCCVTFPHKYNKLYVLCKTCVEKIDKQFRLVIYFKNKTKKRKYSPWNNKI